MKLPHNPVDPMIKADIIDSFETVDWQKKADAGKRAKVSEEKTKNICAGHSINTFSRKCSV